MEPKADLGPHSALADFLNRVKSNAAAKKEAKAKGETVLLKRLPAAPRESRTISTENNLPLTLAPVAYDTTI
jgi:large subunit ribosomal protein L21e